MNTQLTKEILSNIKKINFYNEDDFIKDAECYIKAIKEGRMINVIGSVSASGMSRTIKFTSCEQGTNGEYYQRNYYALFRALGYSPVKNSSYFRVNGCGMDMIFNTNYNNIHDFKYIGLINEEECRALSQKTPPTI